MRNFGDDPGRGFRGGRTPFSGGPAIQIGPGGPLPKVVKRLLIANAALFVAVNLPGVDGLAFERLFGLVPADVFGGGRIWQLVTYMFLHGSLLHIAFNMFLLWMFGTTVERRWGSSAFVWYYLICGLGGAIAQWVSGPSSTVPMVGASAAVLGLLVAYAMMDPDRRLLIWFFFPVKAKYFVLFIAALDLVSAFSGNRTNVAHFAHLGGMLTGYLYLKQDWRVGSLGRKMRAQAARQKMAANARRAERDQSSRDEQMREVNRILEKINREGMDALTPEELRILREASRR